MNVSARPTRPRRSAAISELSAAVNAGPCLPHQPLAPDFAIWQGEYRRLYDAKRRPKRRTPESGGASAGPRPRRAWRDVPPGPWYGSHNSVRKSRKCPPLRRLRPYCCPTMAAGQKRAQLIQNKGWVSRLPDNETRPFAPPLRLFLQAHWSHFYRRHYDGSAKVHRI